MTKIVKKEYLGDSIYVEFAGFDYLLYTDNGHGPSNVIFMEPSVFNKFKDFVERTKAK